MDKKPTQHTKEQQSILDRIKWTHDRLIDAAEMAEFYAGPGNNLEIERYDRGPAERFLQSLETGPKVEPTNA